MALEITLTVTLDEEMIQELFEENEIRFSKAKVTKLKKMIVDSDYTLYEELEETLKETLGNWITEEWEK